MVEGINSINLTTQEKGLNTNVINPQKRVSSQPQSDVVELSTKQKVNKKTSKLSTAQKIGIGSCVLLGLGALAYVLTRGRFGSVPTKQLAEHIEFKKAKTIEDAIEFGKKHLGIKNYEGFNNKDIEVINWINEGLVEVSNYQKGKVKMPEFIKYTKDKSNKTTAYVLRHRNFFENNLTINRNFVENIDTTISKFVKNTESGFEHFVQKSINNITSNIEKFKNKELNLNGKLKLLNDLKALSKETENQDLKIKALLNNPQAKKKLEDLGLLKGNELEYMKGLPKINIDEIDKYTGKTLSTVYSMLSKKTGFKLTHQSASPFRTIFHEMGHLQFKPIGIGGAGSKEMSVFRRVEKYWNNSMQDFNTALKVSDYATTSPSEFVAETYAEMVSGNKIPDDAMKMFERFTN